MGPEINAKMDFIVYLQVPAQVRLARVQRRSVEMFGSRALEGGDLYGQEQEFLRFVAARTLDSADRWAQSMRCPVLYLDGQRPIWENVRRIYQEIGL